MNTSSTLRIIKNTISLILLVGWVWSTTYWVTVAAEDETMENYVWVLVHEIDDRGIEDLEEIGAKLKKYKDAAAEGEFSIVSTLNNTGYFVDYGVQKTFADIKSSAQATISTTPLEIKPNTDIPLNLRVSITENEGYKGRTGDASADASVSFCGNNSTLQDFIPPVLGDKPFHDYEFKSESGESGFDSNETNGYAVHNTIVSGSLPAGTTHGEAIAICAEVNLIGVTMGTVYHYRWLPSGSDDLYGINKEYKVLKDDNGDYIASGIRVSDISGEVYVRRGDASRGEWEMLNIDDVIYEGDVIHTKDRNSRCALALPDLTTFNLRPRSVIILNTRSEQENPISILTGKVMVNLKKIIKDGSMDVEMSQAIAGARGTIFVLETDDKTSSVKVLEGIVEMKSTNEDIIVLSAGEYAIAEDGALRKKETFTLADELIHWEEEVQKVVIADITDRTGEAPIVNVSDSVPISNPTVTAEANQSNEPSHTVVYILAGVGLLIAGAWYWRKRKRSI